MSSYNAALRAKRTAPDFLTCQDDIKYKVFMATNDPSFLRQTRQAKAESVKSNIQPTVGMNVCRQVLANATIYGQAKQIAVDVRGFVDQVSGKRIKVMVTSLLTNVAGRTESLQEVQPFYTKGLPAWEDSDAWRGC